MIIFPINLHCASAPVLSGNSQKKRTRGFTLVEVVTSLAVFMLLSVGVMTFYTNSQRSIFTTTMKLKTSSEARRLTALLDNDGRNSDAIILHNKFDGDLGNQAADDIIKQRLGNGKSGKMIILIYYGEDPQPNDQILPPLDSIVCYTLGLTTDPTIEGPSIYRLEIKATSANEGSLPEALLPKTIKGLNAKELAQGLTPSDCFYRFGTNSVVFNSVLRNGNKYSSVNNVHNFTITSR